MFLNLLKYEVSNAIKTYSIICLSPILLALVSVLLINNEVDMVSGVFLLLYFISIVVCLIYLLKVLYDSIKQRLFDDGGYLTLTMPVKTMHIIIVKLLNGLILSAICFTSILISLTFFYFFVPMINETINMLTEIFDLTIDIHVGDVVIYFIRQLITTVYYTAIMLILLTFINLKKFKNETLAFFGLYFLYAIVESNIVAQIASINTHLPIAFYFLMTGLFVFLSHKAIEEKLDI